MLLLELKRKEKGIIASTKVKQLIGKGITKSDILSSLISGFLIGFKGVEAVFNYGDLVANPQTFILSSKGHLVGGIIIATLFVFFLKYREKSKTKLDSPKWIEKKYILMNWWGI